MAGEHLPRRGAGRRAGILYEADTVCIDYIRKVGLYDANWLAFAMLLPVKTVGVMATAAPARNLA
ncbi:hypothetical protein [Tardiphaga sp. 813_E8_N1_3]|uniref:hypothetical protein n=1 Tax=Tardiphaga sp. 813_E8_N1_3 TaxID=3240760 RepID=UPI003F24DEEA